jgi:DNA-binding HxlR family transcriptional regulator
MLEGMGELRHAPPSRRHDAVHEAGVVCPLYHWAVELIGKRWTGAIVGVLLKGPVRFNEIVATVPGMSDRLCADRLRELEEEGLVVRRVLPGPPLGVEYELTSAGRDLQQALTALGTWAHRWLVPDHVRTGTVKPASGYARSSPKPSLRRSSSAVRGKTWPSAVRGKTSPSTVREKGSAK